MHRMHRMLSATVLGVGASMAGGAEPFSFVALPDTQNYSNTFPEIFTTQTRWIADVAGYHNIVFVTHVGDIVNNGPNLRQWANAKDSMGLLDAAGIPYGTAMGNHDNQYSDAEYQYPAEWDNIDLAGLDYLDHFGPQFYLDEPWYRGSSPSGLSNYQVVDAGDYRLLFLHLEVDVRPAELAWAHEIVESHPDKLVIVTTHRYIYDYRVIQGRFTPLVHETFDPLYYGDESISGQELWEQFIGCHRNIFMVFCGHVDGEWHQVTENTFGLPVYEMLADYQSFDDNGGNGWLRLLTLDPAAGTVDVHTYSPFLGRFMENNERFVALREFGLELLGIDLDLPDVPAFLLAILLNWHGQRDSNFSFENVPFDDYIRPDTCRADIDDSGVVDAADLLALLEVWGIDGRDGDITDDGPVDTADLLALLEAWGPCE